MAEVRRLYRERPRSRLLRAAPVVFLVLAAASWLGGDIEIGDLFSDRRAANLDRFLTEDACPPPLREDGAGSLAGWAGGLLHDPGWSAAGATLAISVLAIVLAGFGGALFSLPAARNFMRPDPFLPGTEREGWRTTVPDLLLSLARSFLLFIRSVPEFIWAYLFLGMFGPSAWPAVLALAIHNTGTLGKLNAEVVENLDPGALRALRAVGAHRLQVAAFGIFPLALPRFLLYFFYRFETCVRESTILGMLGIVSLGYYISEARAVRAYDEMIFFVLLGAGIVLAADLLSAVTRRVIRRAV
jgi:phosphonate transport system permease protein